MNVIVCTDERGGLRFNHRRQSQDRVLVADIVRRLDGKTLYMSPYSAPLFKDYPQAIAREDYLTAASKDDWCFVELENVPQDALRLVRYNWNRHYPNDATLSIDLSQGWEKISEEEFVGSSHERITREEFIREQ